MAKRDVKKNETVDDTSVDVIDEVSLEPIVDEPPAYSQESGPYEIILTPDIFDNVAAILPSAEPTFNEQGRWVGLVYLNSNGQPKVIMFGDTVFTTAD